LGGQLGVQGKVADPLTQLKVNNLVLSVQHQNMNKAIQSFAKGSPRYASLAKPLDFKANVVIDGKVTSISNIKANLAGASVVGALRFDTSAAKQSLAGSLRIGDLVLKSGALSSSAGQKSGGGSSASNGKWSSAPMDTGWLHSMNVDLDIAANSIVYETWNLSKPALKLTLQGGTLDIKDLKAGLYDGQISVSGNISSSAKGEPMSIKMASDITDISIGSLAKALVGSGRIQGEGDVTLNFDVYGTGASQSALVSSLSGEAVLSGSNVVMKGFDLAGLAGALMESSKPLPRIQQIIGSSTSGGQTAFDTVKGACDIKDGVVGISSMVMDGPEAMIVSTGAVSLPRWRIDTDHQVTLKNAKDVAPFNVEIKGPLDNPGNTFGSGLFDTFIRGRLVEKLPGILGDDVTEKLQKFGILPQKAQQPVNDQPANDNVAPAAAAQQEIKPEEAIEGLLRGLLR